VNLVQTAFGRLQQIVALLYVAVGLLHAPDLIVHPLANGQSG
jgi:hypothetical protein